MYVYASASTGSCLCWEGRCNKSDVHGYYVCNREEGMCVIFSQFLVHTAGLLVKPVSLQCSHLSKFDFE